MGVGQREPEDGDRAVEREQWFLRGRTLRGESAAALRFRAYRAKVQRRAALRARLAAMPRAAALSGGSLLQPVLPASPWRSLGPAPIITDLTGQQSYGPVSGRATRVLVDPNDATGNTVYLGGAYGGLWRSTNATAAAASVTWTPLMDDQPTLAVGAIAVQPGNRNLILVGTGEPNSSGDSYYGLGILRSQDGGNSWTLIGSADGGAHPFQGLGFSRIVFSSDAPNLVVAGTVATNGSNLGAMSASTTRGLYYSTDAGATWSYASQTDSGVTIAPGSVSSVVYNPSVHQFFAAIRFHGIYASADGAHWSRLANQPSSDLTATTCTPGTNTACRIYRGELALRPATSEMFLWYVDASEVNRGVFRSSDGGASWDSLGIAGMASCGDPSGCGTKQGAYNLALAAVPASQGTDLYAGAVNLYKCSLTASHPDCSSGWKNLIHAYGCSPLAAPSHVHPDQHDLDFPLANPNVLYIANDGGIYRTLNSAALSGSCSANNPFDNLNGTLGSMTEFVSIALDPQNAGTVLGGTQDNGSPALGGSSTGSSPVTWTAVNGGDGGFTAINPANPSEWFTANTDVSIRRCTVGTACRVNDFPSAVVNDTVGGDHGDFYTPYLLDPQAPGNLIVGTCRVWRGDSSGAGWDASNALSGSLTGDSLPCTGVANAVIRALAAGGPADFSGSRVFYAGTSSGQIWTTTQAGGNWIGGGLPVSGYPISDLAIDPSDLTGATAYATVMGFGVGHVFKTTDAGADWWDISGDLPDAPADAVLVDPGDPNFVYVGNDIGVFASGNGGANWTEYAPAGGAPLPNAPVTRLRAFSNGSARSLVASTYGRGVWQTDLGALGPDFTLAIAPAVAYPGTSATLSGSGNSLRGYNSPVAVTCTGSKLSACSGGVFTPSAAGTAFTASAMASAVGDWPVTVQGTGGDANATTRATLTTLHVVDFAIAPAPPVSISRGNLLDVAVTLTALGAFSSNLTVSCDPSSLPAGVTCAAASAYANPSQARVVNVPVSVGSSVPDGSYTVALVANADTPRGSRTQTLQLNVGGAAPDFSLTASANGASNVSAGQPVAYTITVSPQFGAFNNPVALSCLNPPRNLACAFAPSSVTPGPGPAAATLTVSTVAPTLAGAGHPPRRAPFAMWFGFPVLGLALAGIGSYRGRPRFKSQGWARTRAGRGRWTRFILVLFVVACIVLGGLGASGCGGGGAAATVSAPLQNTATPPGTYTVSVVGSSGSTQHSTNVTLTVH